MTEYTPNDGDVRWQYVVKRMHDGATWMHADQEYTRWLAAHDVRVKRDAWDARAAHIWDEGYEARQDEEASARVEYGTAFTDTIPNPYREKEN